MIESLQDFAASFPELRRSLAVVLIAAVPGGLLIMPLFTNGAEAMPNKVPKDREERILRQERHGQLGTTLIANTPSSMHGVACSA